MNKDLTIGKPETVLWQFCLPLFGSIVFQQLYNIADSLVAGKFIGENALAAVGNSYEITLIFIAFAFGCNMGCSVLTAVRGKKVYSAENCRNHCLHIQRGSMCHADAFGYPGLRLPSAAHPHTGRSLRRLKIISGYLYMGASVCLFLQHRNRYLLGPGRFQNTILLSGCFLHIQYCGGYPVRNSTEYGGLGCGMGYLSLSGHQLYPGCFDRMATADAYRHTGKNSPVRLGNTEKNHGYCHPEYITAKLYIRGKYSDSKCHQRFRSLSNGRIFRRGKTE